MKRNGYNICKTERVNILEKLALRRRDLQAWALYDWANSAFVTTVVATVLPIYYADVAGADLPPHLRTAYWGYASGIGLLIVALISPILGAASDYLGAKKKFLFCFLLLGIFGSAGLYFVGRGDWLLAAVLCIIGNIGFSAGNVFYEALLPHIARDDEIDRVSAAGFALGYVGGGVLLLINLSWIMFPDFFGFADKSAAVRWSFVSVAVWWAVFSVPLFLFVPEPPASGKHQFSGFHQPILLACKNLWQTFRHIRAYKEVFLFLCAFWLYMEGIGTIIKMATIYGKEIGIASHSLIGAFILVQFVGIPFTFAFGQLAGRLGAKRGIMVSLVVYMGISVFGFFMTTGWHFWVLACAVGMVQGGAQALSRSLFASMVPVQKSAEFFGFFSVSSKFAGVLGPFFFGVLSQSMGGSRYSILFLIIFFIIGMALLAFVDVDRGRAARDAVQSYGRG